MPFDQPTRHRLQQFVADAAKLLTTEFTRQLQNDYGLDPETGTVTAWENLGHLDDVRRETARVLRETLAHYQAAGAGGGTRDALQRVAREQAFTTLNRLAALRMAETRGLLIESAGEGYESKGFQLFVRLANGGLGEMGDAYRCYLFSVFDELAVDLPALFDRFSPYGRLFPGETALRDLLRLMNGPDVAELWAEDETIGWIYQYFNSDAERRRMRDESAAPRNSRELAVRNQFFTPRYVVEFLADNTLGRTWLEMTRGETSLAAKCRYLVRRPNEIFLTEGETAPASEEPGAAASQEDALRQPVFIPHRARKDPREIRLLDPACGSMHFGLYAFDLFETIYAESWDAEEAEPPVKPENPDLKPLRESYADRESFLRDAPRLIIEWNLHGIDIDPRAVQIAGLSLWLRAQRSWKEQGVRPGARPAIQRSNIVCAEPMPGETAFLEEFLARHLADSAEGRLLGQLARRVFAAMKLAGEAGSLLKIEEEIAEDIAEAKRRWQAAPPAQERLFDVEPAGRQQALELDVSGISDAQFWERAEERIYAALRRYAEQAEGRGYQRRLFVHDAAQGFAFIDLCRQRYDVVLMNPPFGDASDATTLYLEKGYPCWNNNLLCAFLQRGWNILNKTGTVAAIFDRTAIVKSTYEVFRRAVLLPDNRLFSMADLGWNVLDANVEVVSLVLDKVRRGEGIFFDVRHQSPINKESDLLLSMKAAAQGDRQANVAMEEGAKFINLPNSVLGYDFPAFLRRAFNRFSSLEKSGFKANQGFALKADKHFRLWWEVQRCSSIVTNRVFNGSGFSPFATNLLDCTVSAVEPENLPMDSSTRKSGLGSHRLPGVCFGKRGEYFSADILPAGFIFTVEGQSIPVASNTDALELLAYLNTPVVRYALNKYCGQHKYSGYVNLLPFVRVENSEAISSQALVAVNSLAVARSFDEVQPHFCCMGKYESLRALSEHITEILKNAQKAASDCETSTENAVVKILDISGEEEEALRQFIIAQPQPNSPIENVRTQHNSLDFVASSTLSYCLGCVFGRWDIRYATGEKQAPPLPDPFAPLPMCAPGMLQNADGLPSAPADLPETYPLPIAWTGILADDRGHPDDIERRIQAVLEILWPDRHSDIEAEICALLNVKGLREYLRRPAGFFADHLQRYSKSRRQAPLYWPLSTASGRYTLWLYYPRLTDQTLYTCVNDYVAPKLRETRDAANGLRGKAGGRTAQDERELEALETFETELQGFHDDLLQLAALPWKPDLNDGVQITAAPLLKLFRLPKWQKVLRETWGKLERGDFDWAHLARSVWPERVAAKCQTDKSLAIAHGLETLYKESPAAKKRAANPLPAALPDGEEAETV